MECTGLTSWRAFVNLKNKSLLFYQQKWVYSGITENCNLGRASYVKTIDKSNKQNRGTLFYGGGSWEGLF